MDVGDLIVPNEAQEFIHDSNEVLRFKLVRSAADMEEEEFFPPEMTHQVYGESEQIFGYRDLHINFFVTAGRLSMYCDIKHDGRFEQNRPGDLQPDDLLGPLTSLVPPNTILDNKDTFLAMMRKENKFRPFGEQIHRYTTNKDDEERTFEVFLCSTETTPGFVDYFERVQMFTMFYIDAASYLDNNDPKWRYFLVFEKYPGSDGNSLYAFVGFATVYEFYGYPENIRPRISQMLILPPFQRLGIATALLTSIYDKYTSDPKVLTIAVEDPSAVFSALRLQLDCNNCLKLPQFTPDRLRSGITQEHFDVARDKLKLNKDSVRKVFNVLRLRATRRDNPRDFRSFRLFVKNQLYSQFRRQDKEMAKLSKQNLSPEEISELLSFVPKEKREEMVHQEYLELESRLLKVVEKLPALSDEEKKAIKT